MNYEWWRIYELLILFVSQKYLYKTESWRWSNLILNDYHKQICEINKEAKQKQTELKISWFVINMFFPLPLRAWMIESMLKFISQLPQIKRILKLDTLLVEASNISQTLNLLKILFCSLRLFLSLRFFYIHTLIILRRNPLEITFYESER